MVEQESSADKAWCALDLTLTLKRMPQERWHKPHRSHSQARDRYKHNRSMFKRV
jgi:hypothetical protein